MAGVTRGRAEREGAGEAVFVAISEISEKENQQRRK